MTSSTFRTLALRAAAPAATLIGGLAFAASLALPGVAFAAPQNPSDPFNTVITVQAPVVTGTTAKLSATLDSTFTVLGHTTLTPLNDKTLTFKIGTTTVGHSQTNTNGKATLNNVSLSGFPSGTYVVTVSYAGEFPFIYHPSTGTNSITFTTPVIPPAQLPAPTNLTPVNDATTTDQNFDQTWSTVVGADHYVYQVTDTYDGTTFTSEASDDSTDANYVVTAGTVTRHNSGAPLKSYYWRVAAVDAHGNVGIWSPVTEVTVVAVVVPPTLTAPILVDPVNDATTTNPAFDNTWLPVTGAANYQYQTSNTDVETAGVLSNIIFTDESDTASNYDLTDPSLVTRHNNSGTPAGDYFWQVRAIDSHGNFGPWSAVNKVTYQPEIIPPADTTPPTVTITPDSTNILHGTETFTITINDANPATTTNSHIWVYLYNNGGTQKHSGQSVDLSSGTGTFTVNTTLLDDGASTIDVGRLQDAAGNWSGAGDNYFSGYIVDNTGPVVTVTPEAGSTLSGLVTFDITLTDANPLDSTKNTNTWVYLYNAAPPQASQGAKADLSSGHGTFTVDTTKLANGDAWLDVGQVYDGQGNVSGPTGDNYFKDYIIDNTVVTAPSVPVLETPVNGATLNTNDFWFTWDASTDNGPGPVTYEFQSSQNPATTTDGVLTSGIWSSGVLTDPTIHSTGAGDGAWYWQVRAVDATDNLMSDWSPVWTVNLDTSNNNVGEVIPPATPSVTTNDASDLAVADATLNGTNGPVDATGHSFWVSADPIDDSSANIPAGVYSTPDMGVISSSTAFTADLASLTTDAVTTGGATGVNLPAITPDTTYHYVAWVKVGDTWYHGDDLTFTTASADDGGGDVAPTPSATTNDASDFTMTDATLNGTNGDVAADESSFWVSTSPFVTGGPTATPAFPNDNVYSDALPAVATDTPFSASLSSLTSAAYPSPMPAVTASTTYYYAAWTEVDGTWYPGAVESFSTTAADNGGGDGGTVTDPSVPTLSSPSNGATVTTSDFPFEWNAPTDNSAVSYEWESSLSDATTTDGSFVTQLADQSGLTATMVDSPNTPNDTYYWHVRANNGTDNSAWSDTWSVTVNATAVVGQAPVAQDASYNATENTPMPITLTVADTGTVTYTVTQPTNGTVTQTGDGPDVVYTPNTNYTGGDSFTYQAHNGQDSNVATILITVASGNDEHENSTPVSTDVSASSVNDAPVTITLAATDADNDPLTYATTSSPTNGTLSAISGNTVVYTPNSHYAGSDTFNFTASDGQSTSTPSTVTITVTAPTFQQNFSQHGTSGGTVHNGGNGGGGNGGTSGQGGTSGSVLGASTYNFTKNLTIGSKGEDVTQLQMILIADGYLTGTQPTGYFGQMTKAAVKLYQAAHNITPVSGFVGPITRAALNAGTV